MAAKRRASNQLTHDNWDDDEQEEEPGQSIPISPGLHNRVIKKAKRVLGEQSSSEDAASPSPFSGFGGFGKRSASSTFSWKKPTFSTEMFAKKKENGAEQTEEAELKTSHQKRFCPSQEKKVETSDLEHFQRLQKLNESVLKWMQVHMAKNPYCDFTPVFDDYKSHLSEIEHTYPLQKAVVSSAFKSNSSSTSFKMPECLGSGKSTSFFADSSADSIMKSGFSKFMKVVNESAKEEKGNSSDDSEMSYGAGFTSNTTNTSTVSRVFKSALTATSSGSPMGPTSSHSAQKKDGDVESGHDEEQKDDTEEQKETSTAKFQFKTNFGSSSSLFGKKDNAKSDSEPFSFASAVAKPFSFSALPATSSASDNVSAQGEDEYVPPKNEISAVVEKDALYSKRCKLFYQKNGTFVDKGIGILYLKPLDGKTQLLVRADTNLGNILLNIILTSSLPIERSGKNNVLIVCVPNPPIDTKNADSKTAIPMLIRVKTSADADELAAALHEHKS